MGTTNSKNHEKTQGGVALVIWAFALAVSVGACTHKVQIEPSDKPFVVNLNVKIDHGIRVKIEDQNKDLIDLEDRVLEEAKKKKKS